MRAELPRLLAFIAAASCAIATAHADVAGPDLALIERGRYLTVLADCQACHEDRAQSSAFGGGRPIATPFGTVVAANITPDQTTGIGSWTDAQFDKAVRRGRMPNGKRLYPAMPFPYYAKMSAQDTSAIHAYLKTISPVHHAVRSDELPFPFSIRPIMIVWDWLYFNTTPWRARPDRSAVWNRGAYLVAGPGHCGACHTAKTILGSDKGSMRLRGYSQQGWFAPNLTQDRERGLADWSETDIAKYLRTGHNRFAGASGPMAEEVADSSAQMTEADVDAIAVYLKAEPGDKERRIAPLPASDPRMRAGAAIYADECTACHMTDGRGVPDLMPNLAASASLAARAPTTLLRVVLHGANTVATSEEPTAPQMPAYAWQLTDAQVAAVCTYIRNSWGHAGSAISVDQVRAARSHTTTGS